MADKPKFHPGDRVRLTRDNNGYSRGKEFVIKCHAPYERFDCHVVEVEANKNDTSPFRLYYEHVFELAASTPFEKSVRDWIDKELGCA